MDEGGSTAGRGEKDGAGKDHAGPGGSGGSGGPCYHPLVRAVARGLRRRCRVPAGAGVLVAVSGGADSVALLRVLALLAGRRGFEMQLSVAHVNHHLRGADADADALFVQALADGLGLPCELSGVHLDPAGNREAVARRARYGALAQAARRHGASFIATAHHADDQLETLLMRVIRGASVRGLRGIAPRRRLRNSDASPPLYVVRPMLAAGRSSVVDFLGVVGQRWREDASNTDTALLRNRLRHQVVPLIKAIREDAPQRAVRLSEHFTDLYRLVQEQAPRLDDHAIPRAQARGMNAVVLDQALRSALARAGVGRDQMAGQALRPVVRAAQDGAGGSRTFGFARGVTITITRDRVAVHHGPAA